MDEYYRIKDAASKMHISPSTLYRWIRQGKISSRHVKTFPNGMIAVNGLGLIRPRSKPHIDRASLKNQKISNKDLSNG